jgi:hypothetical protein
MTGLHLAALERKQQAQGMCMVGLSLQPSIDRT